jgi:hypothetical protein
MKKLIFLAGILFALVAGSGFSARENHAAIGGKASDTVLSIPYQRMVPDAASVAILSFPGCSPAGQRNGREISAEKEPVAISYQRVVPDNQKYPAGVALLRHLGERGAPAALRPVALAALSHRHSSPDLRI